MKPRSVRDMLPRALPSIWRFALSLTGDIEMTNDLSQSTCLRAVEKADQFRSAGSFEGWCLQICRSIWLNELRSRASRQDKAFATVDVDQLPDIAPGIEQNLFAREIISKVMALPDAQRSAVELVFVQQFTYSEAAVILDVPIGTVMSRLHAARKVLRKYADVTLGESRKEQK
ncbi:sigma-70 family RNA polymerase sigma factor [uncultured Roseibium sp.]|uniref:RNA polymerase sigma factor n=1 Tax=uncultured Roseibium sp. TaxID=1936171 RepID=UPI00262DE387|nr:sigma-70 family RNA polymerase sigma factor [uncultured Roseibium sp.]